MAKIIKFLPEDNFEEDKEESKKIEDVIQDQEMQIKKAVEEHVLANFAVKNVLGMDIVYKINKNDIGVIGVLSYEHKRREGMFIAEFIAKGVVIKDKYSIDTLAFKAGEPQLHDQIHKILKAKKTLPDIS
ncbi:MAG: hypothetical protein N2Z81_05785 [Hydrogenothermaceae bacterium]|nr:hypothetical protein [Hydrogenothermaceae bacterium]